MLSIRAAARSAPRTLTRMSSAAIRQSSRTARPSSSLTSSWTAPLRTKQFTSAFSTSPLRREQASETDQELSVKLGSELDYEGSVKESTQQPTSVKDFLDNSPYELQDTPGHEEVVLTRKFGNETITVSFSISDLSSYEPDQYNQNDPALSDDEEMDMVEGKQRMNKDPENEDEEDLDQEDEPPMPCHLRVIVEKPGQGALEISAAAEEGNIMVQNFHHYKDAAMAHSKTPETANAADIVYAGPPFNTLDEDLQILMERYLEERGISQAMALFVADYMDIKEQREYQNWLKNVKGFIDA
ncbi:mitochondrial glycoprotein [Xylariaceae sp. FL0804]|nr:mitochondrial glycoprotein [Xylariaceae sp. FL0804]